MALGVAALALGAAVVSITKSPPKKTSTTKAMVESERATSYGPIGEAKPGYKDVGGVYRPEVDVNFAEHTTANNATPKPLIDMGLSPPVKSDTNPAVASVYEALKSRENPERFSSFVQPKPFDAVAYRLDAQVYLNTVEPGRVFQAAEPGPDVTPLQVTGKRFHRVTQEDQVVLSVQAEPNAPVTFTSFKLGHFQNQLTSTTVQANAEGRAEARFTAASGTIDNVEILAASPMNSGQARFLVNVKLPQPGPPAGVVSRD